MSDHPPPLRLHRQLEAIWGNGRGWQRLAAVNHTVIGRRFMVTALAFFLIGGVLAMLIRSQLASAASPFMEPGLYAQVFTMHGTIMMFLFAIPMFEGFAIYLLPKLLGARDMAFPRLSAYGYWCYLFGGTLLVGALLAGVAPDSGWFMYTPLSSRPHSPGINADFWLLGVTFVEISALSAAVEIIVSILKLRAPGMSLERMPIFAWYMLVVAGMMLVGFPPLILGSILLELERAFDLPFFDPARGGDPLLWQHLFWLFGHPEVYIIFLPAAGAVSTILPVFAGRPLAGYRAVIVALIAMAFLSFGLWVHHMYTVGIPHLALGFFSAASALVAVPTAVQFFAWLATLAHGRPRFTIPMLHIFGFFFTFVIGGLTGVMLAMVAFDQQAHDTHFVVAHLHYVLVGGFVFPMLAAAYYWLPHLTGRMAVFPVAKPAFWLFFIGFNLSFLPMHLTGLRGMPRRVHSVLPEWGLESLNLLSSVAGFIMAMGVALFLIDFYLLARFGRVHRRNPWQAGTLEWAMPTPPTAYGFASLPAITDRADQLPVQTLGADLAAGRGYLGFTRRGWMETLGVEMLSGRAQQLILLPRQTFLPLWTALATGLFFVAMLAKLYWVAPLALLLVLVMFLLWARQTGLREDHGPLPVGRGENLAPHGECAAAPSRMAMALVLTADATLYGSLLFGGLFLWISAPGWPPPTGVPTPQPLVCLLAGAGLVLAWISSQRAVARAGTGPAGWLWLAAGSQMVALAALALLLRQWAPVRSDHGLMAVCFALLAYLALHAFLGLVYALYGRWRLATGHVSAKRTLDVRLGGQWQAYTAAAGLIGLGYLLLLPWLARMGGGT